MHRILILLTFTVSIQSKRLPDIYWNSTNALMETCAAVDDFVDVHCPYTGYGKTEEHSVIYRVSKEEYDECRLGEHPKEIGRCSEPGVQIKLKISFRSFQPNPFALTYKPDTTYYFISTSTGKVDGIANREGGLCTTHALKMKLQIVKRGASCEKQPHGHRKHHHHHRSSSTTTTKPTTVISNLRVESPFRPPGMLERVRDQWNVPTVPLPDDQDDSVEDAALWEHFYQKVDMSPVLPDVLRSRGERVALDTKASEYKLMDTYEALAQQLDREVKFEIHEIGDEPDYLPWRSSTSSPSSSLIVILLLLTTVIYRR